MLSFPNLPQGISVLPGQPLAVVNEADPITFLLSAEGGAASGQITINVQGTLGSITHSYPVSVTINPAAPFHLSLSPSQLSLSAGIPQNVQATIVPDSGAPPYVSFNFTSLPLKSDLTAPILTGTEPGPFTLTFTASVDSPVVSNFQVFVTAASNSGDTSTAVLSFSVSVPFPAITAATRSTVVRTDDMPAGAVYDAGRKLVFTALPNLNEVRVFSSVDAHLVAKISTVHPVSIDESADGSKVFTGSLGQITTIDPDSLQVLKSDSVPTPQGMQVVPTVQLVTLSTGEVMFISGTQPYVWDPAKSTAIPLTVPNMDGIAWFSRSANHTKVLLFPSSSLNGSAAIYDAAAGVFSSTAAGISGMSVSPNTAAINFDGSQVVVLDPGYTGTSSFLRFYDGQFNLLVALPLSKIGGPGQMIYGLDGKSLYVFIVQPYGENVGVAYDTSSFVPLGLFSMADITVTMPLTIDETGMIFGPSMGTAMSSGSLAYTDASHPGAMSPDPNVESWASFSPKRCANQASSTGGAPYPPAPTVGFPIALCTQGTLNALGGFGFDKNDRYSVFVGPPPGSPGSQPASDVSVYSPSELDLTLPSTSPIVTPGPVNLTLTRPDGWYQVIPEAFSYGPTILFTDPMAVLPAGQTTLNIFGYELGDEHALPTVTVGGKPATVVSVAPFANNIDGIFPLQQLQVTAPSGTPGPSDVTVSTAMGTTTFSGGVQYVSSAQTYPITGNLGGLIYDQPRQRLYVSNNDHNRVEIFDLTSKAWLSPISVGTAPTYLSLSPDGSRLAVLNSNDGTVSVIDPSQLKVLATYPGFTPQDQTMCGGGGIGGYSVTTIQPHRALVALACPYVTHVMNLDTGVISCAGIGGCNASGTSLNTGFLVGVLASSPDGTKAFMTGATQVALLDLTRNTLTISLGLANEGANASANADGNLFASNLAIYNSQVALANLVSGVGCFNTQNQGSLGGGAIFNASGSLLYMPVNQPCWTTNLAVDIFDVHRGQLALRVALPEQFFSIRAPMLAVDETHAKIFLLTASGVTLIQLAEVPLSVASVTPASGASGTSVKVRGSGFQNGAQVSFGTSSTTASFVDAMTLTATVPSLPQGPVRVTVKNPDGKQYSFDAAFTVN